MALITRKNTHGLAISSSELTELGEKPAIIAGSGRRPPDRRQVSFRWLSGTFLTGVTSILLMGGALYASLDNQEKIASPPQYLVADGQLETAVAEKGNRAVTLLAASTSTTNIMEVPTVSKVGDSNVIRKRPFAIASAPLAIAPKSKFKYPRFNPLTIFSESSDEVDKSGSSDLIYGADVESEVTVRQVKFPVSTYAIYQNVDLTVGEVENIVREVAPSLTNGTIKVAAIPFFNISRFTLDEQSSSLENYPGITVTAENVSIAKLSDPDAYKSRNFYESVISIRREQSIISALESIVGSDSQNTVIAEALASQLGTSNIKTGYKLRVAIETSLQSSTGIIRRVSVYFRGNHLVSVASRDDGQFVYAPEPAPIPAIADQGDTKAFSVVSRKQLPSIYDGIYRAALSQNLTKQMARRLVRIFAFDVDFQTRISPSDTLSVFYSLDSDSREISENSEILFASITLKNNQRKYYRFRTPDDGVVDYYDESGKSAKKFLLRNPVPNSRFTSAFGMRRHPITGFLKMHTGVDLAAPRGTPILAAGNGVVEKAGWAGGYGKQTVIRHANGYKTTYNHQSRIAKSVVVGARVRQGQVIGAVGTTGNSTGNHLHYEVLVNNNKVNPMGIRLPKGRVLKGETLAAFERERDRINALLIKKPDTGTKLALN